VESRACHSRRCRSPLHLVNDRQGYWTPDKATGHRELVATIPYAEGDHINADARLIASAPDLLAALQDLLAATEKTYDSRHERQAALDAIAKATGQEV